MNTNTLQTYTHNILGIGLSLGLAYYGFFTPNPNFTSPTKAAISTSSSSFDIGLLNNVDNEMNQDHVEKIFQKHLRGSAKKKAKALAAHLMFLSTHYKISPAFILAVIQAESSFKIHAKSSAGAIGLMQVLPPTAKYITKKRKLSHYRTAQDLRNPFVNLSVGVSYLSYLRSRFSHSMYYVAAYNLGPTTVNKMLKKNAFKLGKVDKYVNDIHRTTKNLRKEYISQRFLASAN